jgi:hypothetical protein
LYVNKQHKSNFLEEKVGIGYFPHQLEVSWNNP